tara:strand:- start:91 stop:612 length:522 start_codon:yes stop_codon:yes gene_type:complete
MSVAVTMTFLYGMGDLAYKQKELIYALIVVESNGDREAVGDGGRAYGVLQIHNSYFLDSGIKGKHKDCFDEDFSIKVFDAYMKRYAKDAWTDLKSFDAEKVARIHNGGPRGYKKKATEKYWAKVKKVIEKSKRCASCDAILEASNKRSFFFNPDGSQCPVCHEQRMREKYLYD